MQLLCEAIVNNARSDCRTRSLCFEKHALGGTYTSAPRRLDGIWSQISPSAGSAMAVNNELQARLALITGASGGQE